MTAAARPASDRGLIACIALGQAIGWGTLFVGFPLFVAPMQAELGWSRPAINAGLTLGLLASGLVAVPIGQFVDRRGGRWVLAIGGWAGAALLALWATVDALWAFLMIWLALGLACAAALWAPAMAVVVAVARQPTRAIAGISFITGFTATVFVPLTAALIEALGWRSALLALAALQCLPGVFALWLLPPDVRPAPGVVVAVPSVREMLRRPAFRALGVCFAAHAFIGIGLTAHAIPLLRERGLPEASVLLLVALHGPFQVAARAAMFALGARVTMRSVGRFATALLPVAMLWLALAPSSLAPLVGFALAWAVADGLLTIVRAAGTAEILGRVGYGALSGALSAVTVPSRTAAPVAIALIVDAMGGYAAVPWLLCACGVVAAVAFASAAGRVR